jgi:hypothetical protein
MKYTVEPIVEANCDCEECRAGRHFYELGQWEGDHWHWCAFSLRPYASAKDCKRFHYWGDFQPGDTWEDGTPISPPETACPEGQPSCGGGMVRLNTQALASSFEAVLSHGPRFQPGAPTPDGSDN